jgi:Zn-dependent protease/predicted transcriptional regulator
MGTSFRLGRVFGIELGINWSWLVVFVLITWSLASGILPAENPGLSDTAYVVMAIVAALAFFASLVAHEYGHALVARREGMEIEGITLWLFGGVAKFKGMFPSAGAEFRIAIAGPLVSLALGVLFVLVAAAAGLPDAVDGVVAWLGYINLALLVFNLLPALPLDGGRVLRSVLWHVRGDFRSATRLAAGIGRGFGYLFIAGGVLLFVVANAFSGAWLAFIGFFLLQAASGEARYVATREALAGLRVRDLMVREPVTIDAGSSIGRAMDDVVWSRRFTTYPVVADGRVLGLLPFRRLAEVPRAEWDERTVREVVVPLEDVPVLAEGDEAIDALVELAESDVRRGLVLDEGELAGIVSITDLARALEAPPRRRRR